jgi:hypothetical protein
MPVPKPKPSALINPNFEEFAISLSDSNRHKIAAALSEVLHDDAVQILEERIKKCRCALEHNTATPGAAIAAIDDLLASGRDYMKTLELFTATNTGVDAETQENLKPIADQVLTAARHLERRAGQEIQRLRRHPRVTDPKYEILKMHCGLLRLFFHKFAHPGFRVGPQAKERLQNFVKVVCEVADIKLPLRSRDIGNLIETDVPEEIRPYWARKVNG